MRRKVQVEKVLIGRCPVCGWGIYERLSQKGSGKKSFRKHIDTILRGIDTPNKKRHEQNLEKLEKYYESL